MIAISIVNGITVLGALIIIIKSFGRTISPISVAIFIFLIFDTLGGTIAPYIYLGNIPYIPGRSFLIEDIDTMIYFRQCFSYWIFIFIYLLGFFYSFSKYQKYFGYKIDQNRVNYKLWAIIFFLVGIAFSFKYYILGPGIEILLSTKLRYFSTEEAVRARIDAYNLAGFGRGAFLSWIAAFIFFPLSAAFIKKSKFKFKNILFLICLFLSLGHAFQMRQKLPIAIVGIIYGYYIYLNEKEKKFLFKKNKLIYSPLVLILIIGFFVNIFLYIYNFNLNMWDSLRSVFYRAFIIPPTMDALYFYAFPNLFDFRGIKNIFSIELGRNIIKYDDVTIYDVAFYTTGDKFSSNASFLAIAWSGAGYLGIILISLIFVLLDLFILRQRRYLNEYLYSITYLYGLIGGIYLINGAFLNFLISIFPILIIIIINYLKRIKV